MRILFDHQIFSYQTYGGTSRYFSEILNIFHQDQSQAFDLAVQISPNEYLANMKYYRGMCVRRTSIAQFFCIYAINELATRRAAYLQHHEILHATFYDPTVLGSLGRSRLVVTVLDMIPERYPEHFSLDSLYGRLVTRRWIEGKRALCQRADAILAISENTKRDLVEFYRLDPNRITVTYLGNRLYGTQPELPKPVTVPQRYILFVGTRNGYKNFTLFIKSAAPILLDDLELEIVCIGGGKFSEAERELFSLCRIGNRIHQMSVSDSDLAAIYSHALVFVFPSLYEGFGIPILEAFSCSCPVLLANASCFPEIAGDAAMYFDPQDLNSLSSALHEIIYNVSSRDLLRTKGADRARTFTWDRTACKTLDVYRTLL